MRTNYILFQIRFRSCFTHEYRLPLAANITPKGISLAPLAQISSAHSAHTQRGGTEREVFELFLPFFFLRRFLCSLFATNEKSEHTFFGDNYFCGTKAAVFCVRCLRQTKNRSGQFSEIIILRNKVCFLCTLLRQTKNQSIQFSEIIIFAVQK